MDTDNLMRKSDEVLICSDDIVSLHYASLQLLKEMADLSPKGRARICAHKDNAAVVQEMIILIKHGSYIRPHRHDNKCESFHLIEGEADIVVFKDDGEIEKVIKFSKEHAFYYRLDSARFHTIVVRSEYILFHEVTNGPFVQNETEFSKFSPQEQGDGINDFLYALDCHIKDWMMKSS